jgi:hypothetical protein
MLPFLFNPATVLEILNIRIYDNIDSLLWTPSSGVFTTKSAHHLLTSNRHSTFSPLPPATWKALWKLKLNHRLRLFL